jgi:hypothetical protein
VQFEAKGRPIGVIVCYCDDCQQGSRQLELLPNAKPILDADGGSPYVLYRKDRFECTKGRELLQDTRLKVNSPTRRVIARCCNSAVYLDFQKGHWLSVYRTRFSEPPAVQMHIQTRFRPQPQTSPSPVPSYRSFPPLFVAKLLATRLAMIFT